MTTSSTSLSSLRVQALAEPGLSASYLALYMAMVRAGAAHLYTSALRRAMICSDPFGRAYEVFGNLLMRQAPNTKARPIEPSPDAGLAPIYVLGSSHARSFARGSLFLPFMLGSANRVCFLTDAAARNTLRILDEHLSRLPPGAVALIVLSNSDVITLHGRLDQEVDAFIADDPAKRLRILNEGIHRYLGGIKSLIARHPSIKLMVFNTTPMLTTEGMAISRFAAATIARICGTENIAVIDIFNACLSG